MMYKKYVTFYIDSDYKIELQIYYFTTTIVYI